MYAASVLVYNAILIFSLKISNNVLSSTHKTFLNRIPPREQVYEIRLATAPFKTSFALRIYSINGYKKVTEMIHRKDSGKYFLILFDEMVYLFERTYVTNAIVLRNYNFQGGIIENH